VAEKKGLLEVADRGTVVLDEIGDLDTAIQPKLLKALEEKVFRRLGEVRERTVSFRLIAATNRDLREGLANGSFREDLYYRVSTFPIEIPPLRARPEDIGALAERILADQERERGIHARLSPAALERLQSYQWPGNIRELRNVLDRATLYCRPHGEITADHLFLEPTNRKAAASAVSGAPEPLDEVIRKHIIATLEYERGDVVRAASRLGIPRSTLYQRINQLGLDPSAYR
jgi:transcriptional regulator with PAS, ATPase and Fis domain